MTRRTLSLKREALTELSATDLRDVVAGQAASVGTCAICDVAERISRLFSCQCPTAYC